MLLLAIVLPVIMEGVSLATRTGDQARRRTEAGTLADSKIAELVATGAWEGGTLTGDFGPDWPDYHWNALVQDWTEGTQSGLEQLELHVAWGDRPGQDEVVVTTLVYNGANGTGSSSSSSTSTGSGSSGGSGGKSSGSGKSGGAAGSSGKAGG